MKTSNTSIMGTSNGRSSAWLTLVRLLRIGWPFWRDCKRVAWGHLFFMIALLLANGRLLVFINETAGSFMTAVEKRSLTEFDHYLIIYAAALALAVPIQVGYAYLRTRLALRWRYKMASNLIKRYHANRAYYYLIRDANIDNPDQRISQDPDTFCNSSIGLGISALESIITISLFSGLLWSISDTLTYTVIGYAVVGSILAISIGHSLAPLAFRQSATEASLRFVLANTRRDANSVALYRTENLQAKQATEGLQKVISTLTEIMQVNRNLQSFTVGYNLLVPLIPAAICAPLYFHHEMEFGVITQATMAITAVFNAATILIHQFNGISSFTANINRLGSFIEALEMCEKMHQESGSQVEVKAGNNIIFDDVTLLAPDSTRPLITELSLRINPGTGLLICGNGGLVKAGIVNAITGLELSGSGKMECPMPSEIMYLSTNPQLPDSSLHEILSADLSNPPSNVRMVKTLQLVKLTDLAARCGSMEKVQNWKSFISNGEQQRLALARLLLANPRYAIIDDATSVLGEHGEQRLYAVLRSLDCTIITVSNNPLVAEFHDQVLEVNFDGSWTLRNREDAVKQAG